MSNENKHEILTHMVQFMLDIYRFRYGLILIKFAYNYIDMVYHTINLSSKDFKYLAVHSYDIQFLMYC